MKVKYSYINYLCKLKDHLSSQHIISSQPVSPNNRLPISNLENLTVFFTPQHFQSKLLFTTYFSSRNTIPRLWKSSLYGMLMCTVLYSFLFGIFKSPVEMGCGWLEIGKVSFFWACQQRQQQSKSKLCT